MAELQESNVAEAINPEAVMPKEAFHRPVHTVHLLKVSSCIDATIANTVWYH